MIRSHLAICLQGAARAVVPVAVLTAICAATCPGRGLARTADAITVLVLVTSEQAPAVPSGDRFVAALTTQLAPYGIATRSAAWQPPALLQQQLSVAHRLGSALGARAVIWYRAHAPPGAREIRLRLLDLADDDLATHALHLGHDTQGIERSMALALRTLLRARMSLTLLPAAPPASAPAPARPAPAAPDAAPPSPRASSPAPGPATRPALPSVPRPAAASTTRPAVAARAPAADARKRADGTSPDSSAERPGSLTVGIGYALDSLPTASELRHGPAVTASWWAWPRIGLRGALRVAFLLPDAHDGHAWSRQQVSSCAGLVGRLWPGGLAGTVGVEGGGEICSGAVFAQVDRGSDGAVEGATMWELELGLFGGASVRLSQHIDLHAAARVGWLPVEHRLQVRGREAGRSGGLAIGLTAGARIEL